MSITNVLISTAVMVAISYITDFKTGVVVYFLANIWLTLLDIQKKGN